MNAIQKAAREAARQYVHGQPLEQMRAFCDTAEEWFDGTDSMMKKFSRRYGQLDSAREYQKLANEAEWALNSCTLPEWRQPLSELSGFAFLVCAIEDSLLGLARKVDEIANYGAGDSYIIDVVHAAIRDARARAVQEDDGRQK